MSDLHVGETKLMWTGETKEENKGVFDSGAEFEWTE